MLRDIIDPTSAPDARTAHWSGPRPRLGLRGHSGSEVQLAELDGKPVVVKFAAAGSSADRLERQIDKQRQAGTASTLPYVRIPAVLDELRTPAGYFAMMEYLYLKGPVEYFATVSRNSLRRLADMLLGYLESNIASASPSPIDPDQILSKLESIRLELERRSLLERYAEHLDDAQLAVAETGTITLPLAACHGDLTMSNLLIAQDSSSIGLIDFLDSYLESPLTDIVKLRQDTRYQWTLLMMDSHLDRLRFKQTMNYLDNVITESFNGSDWYQANVRWCTAVNLLRIAPYATTESVHTFILTSLHNLKQDGSP